VLPLELRVVNLCLRLFKADAGRGRSVIAGGILPGRRRRRGPEVYGPCHTRLLPSSGTRKSPRCKPFGDADFERLSVQQVPRRQKISGRLWKRELQKLANELGLDIVVSHLPPGTSKWNKIEHRLFSFISQNWRAQPLVSYRVIVELISATTHQNRPHRVL
jgi:hypothetical protein